MNTKLFTLQILLISILSVGFTAFLHAVDVPHVQLGKLSIRTAIKHKDDAITVRTYLLEADQSVYCGEAYCRRLCNDEKKCFKIDKVLVESGHRNKKIGSLLLRTLLYEIQKEGYERISLFASPYDPDKDSLPALKLIAFYGKYGFQVVRNYYHYDVEDKSYYVSEATMRLEQGNMKLDQMLKPA